MLRTASTQEHLRHRGATFEVAQRQSRRIESTNICRARGQCCPEALRTLIRRSSKTSSKVRPFAAWAGGATASPAKGPQTDILEKPSKKQEAEFSWTKQWYPIAIAADLPTDRPTAARLLGRALVLWRDSNQEWHCWQDLCPHRLVPLSEGRVENGELMCSYHGWTFKADGSCSNIPQAENDKSLATALSSRRSCAVTHPTRVANGLVWVWPEAGSDAAHESEARRPATHPLADDPTALWLAQWFVRDLPYGSDVLAENVLDPSHVGFSHHGVLGNRNKPTRFSMSAPAAVSAQDGWQLTMKREANGKRTASEDLTVWQPPCLVKYEYGNGMVMLTHAVPTDPGRSRLFFALVQPADRAPRALKLLLPLMQLPWLQFRAHFGQHNVLDGDSVFLHRQDESLGRHEWGTSYFMPTSKDFAVLAFRRWLAEKAGPIDWGKSPRALPQGLGMRDLLDRYSQHTESCPSCSRAFRFFSNLRIAAAAAALFTGLALTGMAARSVPWPALLKTCVVAGALALAAAWASRVRQKFIYVAYNHFEHN